MQFSSSVRRGALKLGDKQESYPLSVQFYLQPPTENISLIEFESFAVDRLKCEYIEYITQNSFFHYM